MNRSLLVTTGVVRDPIYLEHDTGTYHPESPRRLQVLYRMLDEEPLPSLCQVSPRRAGLEEICYVHTESYVRHVASLENRARASLDPDTLLSPRSFQAALFAAGGVLSGIDLVMEGELDNGFALVRPPGHHAEADYGKGFCIFNNIAVGAEHALRHHGVERILIVDWDLHHGNGTQHSFYQDNRVLYFSTHQYPYYPGTGGVHETGTGAGEGFTVNVPMEIGCGDGEFYRVYSSILEPIARCFAPQLVLVSAGFDAYMVDPLGGMELTPAGFAALARLVMGIAADHAGGRLLLALEGGYNLEGLQECVKQVLKQLAGEPLPVSPDLLVQRADSRVERTIQQVREVQGRYWSCFS
ncbi:MAG: histone deacetylase [Spirochaetota bacterium]